jgi:hypothetical protein
MSRIAVGWFLLAAASLCAEDPACLACVPVPSAANRQGEVRLVAVGDPQEPGLAVEAILLGHPLSRALHRIHREETTAWPPGSDHHGESQRFLAALARQPQALAEAVGPTPDPLQPVQTQGLRLAIAFRRYASRAEITFDAVRLAGDSSASPAQIAERRPLSRLAVDPAYLRANQAHQLAAALRLDSATATLRLEVAEREVGLTKP